MKPDTPARHAVFIVVLLVASVAISFCISIWTHLYAEDFFYLVEAPCDPARQVCYVRSCDDEECPPNELEQYRVFSVPARAFKRCEDNSCRNVCAADDVCEEIPCLSDEATCSDQP